MRAIAIVTGASSGLGREFVRQLDAGALGPVDEIWAVARNQERLDALARICATPVRPFALDLTDPASFDALDAALAAEPDAHVSALVNNAGYGTFGDFALGEKDDAGRMVRLLCLAPVELTYRALGYMHGGSRIVNVASVAAFMPQPGLSVYAAAKRFVLDFSRALDAELAPVDIHATAVCPKFMRTAFLSHVGDARVAGRMAALTGFEHADAVAAAALRAAKAGRSLCIPSADMKLFYAAAKLLPYRACLAVERALMR